MWRWWARAFCSIPAASISSRTARCSTCTPTCPAAPWRWPRWWRWRSCTRRSHADAWLAITENNIGPNAYRPQEVVRACNGTTIQVIHTDAEGRMVLADTLALAARTRPRLTIDFATLTGACVYALTERYSGVFTNRPQLARRLRGRRRQPAASACGIFRSTRTSTAISRAAIADIMQCARRRQGRSHPGGAFPETLHRRRQRLGACGSVVGHAARRPGARRHRDHRLRRALHARAAADGRSCSSAQRPMIARTAAAPAR